MSMKNRMSLSMSMSIEHGYWIRMALIIILIDNYQQTIKIANVFKTQHSFVTYPCLCTCVSFSFACILLLFN